MRSRAPLVFIEQAVMLTVFALAAVLCLRGFLWADSRSAESERLDQALVQAQSAAEVLKNCGGDFSAAAEDWGGTWDGTTWTISFDDSWQQVEEDGTYLLMVSPQESRVPLLGRAVVEVFHREKRLTGLEVAWQEVSHEE